MPEIPGELLIHLGPGLGVNLQDLVIVRLGNRSLSVWY